MLRPHKVFVLALVLFAVNCVSSQYVIDGKDIDENAICDTLWHRNTQLAHTTHNNGLLAFPGLQATTTRELIERFTGHYTGSTLADHNLRYIFDQEGRTTHVNIIYDCYPLVDTLPTPSYEKYVIVVRNPIDSIYESLNINRNVLLSNNHFAPSMWSYINFYNYWLTFAQENPSKCLVVEFEKLMRNTLYEITAIADFIGDSSRQRFIDECVVDILDDCTYHACRLHQLPPAQMAARFSIQHLQMMNTSIPTIIQSLNKSYSPSLFYNRAYDA